MSKTEVSEKNYNDCLECRLTSGFGCLAGSAYAGYNGMKQNGLAGRAFSLCFAAGK